MKWLCLKAYMYSFKWERKGVWGSWVVIHVLHIINFSQCFITPVGMRIKQSFPSRAALMALSWFFLNSRSPNT